MVLLLFCDIGIIYEVTPGSIVATSSADSAGRALGIVINLSVIVPTLVWVSQIRATIRRKLRERD